MTGSRQPCPAPWSRGLFLREGAAALALTAFVFVTAGVRADGAADRGRTVYDRCLACHAVAHDRVGPRHCGIKGRRAGGLPGFEYSDAMRAAGLTWNRRTLDLFLADPLGVVPGTTMTYDGIKDGQERQDVVAYLLSLPPCGEHPGQ